MTPSAPVALADVDPTAGLRPLAAPSVLRLNVGGTLFLTSWATLSARGPNFLTTLVTNHYSNGLRATELSDGSLFIDRSGVAFEYVLQFLRSGALVAAGGCTPSMLRDELAFYAIPLDDDEHMTLSDSHAQTLFARTVETNLSYEEVRRFLHSLWPSLLPYLSSRAQQGLSHALLVVRRSALGDGRVAYSLPELHFEFVSRIDFNLSSDSWSGGNGWTWLSRMIAMPPYNFRADLSTQNAQLEWSISWFLGGIKHERHVGDVYELLSHAIKRRADCGGLSLVDAPNCKCYWGTKDSGKLKTHV